MAADIEITGSGIDPLTSINDLMATKTFVYGYIPFMPDAGIYCGGYQGPTYPNPSILFLEDFGPTNPSEFFNGIPKIYTMKIDGDIYLGLGKFEPGTNYLNPGHILGIFDTYARMSFGLGVIEAARSVSTEENFSESLPILFPFLTLESLSAIFINSDYLYPAFVEIPSDYVKNMTGGKDNDGMLIDPWTGEGFTFTPPYEPVVSEALNFPNFNELAIESYREHPEGIQQIFNDLQLKASAITNDNIAVMNVFPGAKETIGTLDGIIGGPEDFGLRLMERVTKLDYRAGNYVTSPTNGASKKYRISKDFQTFEHQSTALTVPQALKLLTGSDEFTLSEDSTPTVKLLEYRSLTQLNAAMNLIPMQGMGYRYEGNIDSNDDAPTGFFDQMRANNSYSIVDVHINIIATPETSGPVIISGKVKFEALEGLRFFLPKPGAPELGDPSDGWRNDSIDRQFSIATSVTNQFTWDRNWFEIDPLVENTFEKNSAVLFERPDGARHAFENPPEQYDGFENRDIGSRELIPGFEFITEFAFEKTLDLLDGLNSIRVRIIAMSLFLQDNIGADSGDEITTSVTIQHQNLDEPITHDFIFNTESMRDAVIPFLLP